MNTFAGTLPEWGFTWYKNLTYGANTSINPFFYGTYLAATKVYIYVHVYTSEFKYTLMNIYVYVFMYLRMFMNTCT
jgi:hypothetical protein